VLLWALAAIGMLWADVIWRERFEGFGGFHKLLVIPLLLTQFRRSDQGWRVLLGFFASSVALLIASWGLVLIPGLPWRGREGLLPGVPVKDYILQSEEFAICAFGLLAVAVELWRSHRRQLAAASFGLAALFVANIAYVATARTTLIIMAALLLLFGMRQFGWKGLLAMAVAGGALAALLWTSSPYLQGRVASVFQDVQAYQEADVPTSGGLRLEFWRRSIVFVREAPVIGNGTGSMRDLFRRSAGDSGAAAATSANPHNQYLAITIQLGITGLAALFAMWLAHLALFRGGGLVAWLGLVVVVQNIVGSAFNSHLFDFTQGWLYVFGVGVLGGMVLRERAREPA
jgi:O-antigen ligase